MTTYSLALNIRHHSGKCDICQNLIQAVWIVISTSLDFTNIWLDFPLAEEAIYTLENLCASLIGSRYNDQGILLHRQEETRLEAKQCLCCQSTLPSPLPKISAMRKSTSMGEGVCGNFYGPRDWHEALRAT